MREAVIEAAALRLRPILMTTGAMVLGAVPLAIATGAGAESRQDIGWVIVGGLLVGTFFTLFVIPVVYTYLSRRVFMEADLEAETERPRRFQPASGSRPPSRRLRDLRLRHGRACAGHPRLECKKHPWMPGTSAGHDGLFGDLGRCGSPRPKMHSKSDRQLMRAEIGRDHAAADKVSANCRAAQLVLDEQREARAEAPFDAAKHLKGRSCDLILVGAGLDRQMRALHLHMRIGDAESHPAIGNQPGSPRLAAPQEIGGDEIVAVGEFEALEGRRNRLLRRHGSAVAHAGLAHFGGL